LLDTSMLGDAMVVHDEVEEQLKNEARERREREHTRLVNAFSDAAPRSPSHTVSFSPAAGAGDEVFDDDFVYGGGAADGDDDFLSSEALFSPLHEPSSPRYRDFMDSADAERAPSSLFDMSNIDDFDSMSPSSPRYEPSSPAYAPTLSSFSPSSPSYVPTSMDAYSPTSPSYVPTSMDAYSPTSPSYVRTSMDAYSPTSPSFAFASPSAEAYSPSSPSFAFASPSAEAYSPSSPSFVPSTPPLYGRPGSFGAPEIAAAGDDELIMGSGGEYYRAKEFAHEDDGGPTTPPDSPPDSHWLLGNETAFQGAGGAVDDGDNDDEFAHDGWGDFDDADYRPDGM